MPPKGLAKTTCMICRKSAKEIPSNEKGSVQCDFCERWFHPECVGMSQEKFKVLLEWCSDGSPSPWKCEVCAVSIVKLDKTIKALSVRQDNLEARQDDVESKVEASADKLENVQSRSKEGNLRDKVLPCEARGEEAVQGSRTLLCWR